MRLIFTQLFFVLLVLVAGNASAQVDPHFSQYYVYPSWLNPALTGAFDGDYRISGIYRNQWNSVASPFQSPGISAEVRTNRNINFGGSILNQTAGDGGYNYLTAYASAAYTGVQFGIEGNQKLVFALQGGIVNRKFNPTKFTTGDQWNPVTGFNANSGSTDLPTKNSSLVFDAGAGLLYYDADPNKQANVYAGVSASHLNQPEDAFSSGAKEKLPMRITTHGGVRLAVSEVLTITPNFLYLRQGTASEIMGGAYAQLKANAETDVMLGANYRVKDAFSPFVGFNHRNMVLGVSYDINTSDLGKMVRGTSSFEISISFISSSANNSRREHFICPRL